MTYFPSKSKSKTLLTFFIITFFITGCSFFEDSRIGSASVTFQLPKEITQKISTATRSAGENTSDTDIPESFLELSLKGGYEATQTVKLTDITTVTFTEIPTGIEVWAEALIYKSENNEKRTLYTGSSEKITVTEGSNPLTLKLKKNETSGGQTSAEEEEEEEPQITYIDIYVSATGDDTDGDGLSLDTAFKTINRACDEIISLAQADEHYKILVSGTITGLNGGVGETYGPTTIPAELTTSMAKSILITGATPQTDWADEDVPEDVIDRGLAVSTNNATNGNAVVVNTEVPVTFENIKITRGRAGDGSAIKIVQGATVKLGNGLLITNNYCQTSNGTVHNEGTLFMYGTAVIGNKNANSVARNDSSTTTYNVDGTNANYASAGGGIYNGNSNTNSNIHAKLYLGYKGYAADGVTPVKSTLSGGIYKNGGGGIYNSYYSQVYFDSGNIMWNAYSNGGGIRNYADATLVMTGGNIMNNTGTNGGGVYNERDSSTFYMSGGTITKNSVSTSGGGVYNGGQFFMSGTAVIGDVEDSTKPETLQAATASEFGNKGNQGGGIYNYYASASGLIGNLYLGYSGFESDNVTLKESPLTGGIYHNYSTYNNTGSTDKGGGGGIYSNGTLKMASGTIANNHAVKNGGAINHAYGFNTLTFEITGGTIRDNSAEEKGGAIYMIDSNGHTLKLNGTVSIPAGSAGIHDIYLEGSNTHPTISVCGPLSISEVIRITPADYTLTNSTMLLLPTGVTDTTIAKEAGKFTITPQTDSNGKPVIYKVKSTEENSGTLSKLEVGDIVFNDGTAVGYHNDLSLSATQKAKAIAVIYNTAYYDSSLTPRKLGVGLKKQSEVSWCTEGANAASVKITSIVCAPPGGSGFASTDYVYGNGALDNIATSLADDDDTDESGKYPAFEFAKNYSSITGNNVAGTDFANNWYLPTPKELQMVSQNYETIENALEKCGASAFEDEYYWTCAQSTLNTSADIMHITSGVFSTDAKTSVHKVCAIREF